MIPHQPHFIGQPQNISALWGYGLALDSPGDFVEEPIAAWAGAEIMTEPLGHLRFGEEARILETSTCILA